MLRETLTRAVSALALAAGGLLAAGQGIAAEAADFGLREGRPYEGVTLTYLLPVAGQYDGHYERVSEFTEMTGITVEFNFVPYGSLLERTLAEKVAGGADPDLINFKDSWLPALGDMFLPLDDLLAEEGISMDRYYQAYVDGTLYQDQVMGLPLRGHAQLMFYRADLLEEHGIAVPETWEQLVEAAKVIKEQEGMGIGMYYAPRIATNIDIWLYLLWSGGGELIEGDRVVFNSDAGVRALEMLSELATVHDIVTPGSVAFEQTDATLSMANGNSAFFMGWWWHYGSRLLGENSTLTAEQVGFAPMPAIEGGTAVSYAMSMSTGINVNSDNQEAAWEFLKWLSSEDLERRNVTEKDVRNEMVAVHRAVYEDPEVNAVNNDLHLAAAASMEDARIVPAIEIWPEIAQFIAIAISEAATGADPRAALDNAAQKAQALLDRRG